jgi:N-acetyl-1-D-myo-inositol-2-amino-2-deoxy-alpha-D-glucopyranoside deacetylase
VHAHPDDESITDGAAMARYVAEGAHVALVTCTRGEQGEIIPAELRHLAAGEGDGLGEYRARELAAALSALGVTDHCFLDELDVPGVRGAAPRRYRDSGMVWGFQGRAEPSPSTPPGAFALVDVDEAASRLAVAVRRIRPQVVVTYAPDGGYGHPDHIQTHRVTMRAVDLASRQGRRPWSVAKVYWSVPRGPSVWPVTTVVDSTAYLGAKAEAMLAHTTQITIEGQTFALSNGIPHRLTGVELYSLARGLPGARRDGDGHETSLFAGLGPGGPAGGRAGAPFIERPPEEHSR